MLVEGRGLIARAFAEVADGGPAALVFARGVADSTCDVAAEYARETTLMDEAMQTAGAAGIPFVYFAGASIYGRFDGEVDENTPLRPLSAYGTHQAFAEERIRAHPGSHLIIRLPNVVGPEGNPRQLIPALADQALAGSVAVQQDAARDIIGVEQVVAAVEALLHAGVANRTVIVATGISTPVEDLAAWLIADLGVRATIASVAGGEAQRFRIDLLRSLAPSAAVFGSGYPRRTIADYAKRTALIRSR